MKTTSSIVLPEEPTGLVSSWTRFWFTATDPFGLHLTRVLTGILLLMWLLPYAGHVTDVYGLQGWFDRQAYVEAARLDVTQMPKPTSWSLLYLCGTNATLIQSFYWGSIVILILFTLGVGTRLTSVGAWLVVASFTASPLFDEEIDPMLQLLTLYLAVGYLLLGQWTGGLSLWERLLGPRDTFLLGGMFTRREGGRIASHAANVALRLLQVHLAIVLVTSGVHKLQIGEWWAGTVHWFNIYPAMGTSVARAREHARDANWFFTQLNVMAYATLAWQIFFPTFAWRSGWFRLLLLGGAILGWAGLAWLYQLPLFGAALAIGCLAFLSGQEWAALGQLLQRVSPLKRLGEFLPEDTNSSWQVSTAGSVHSGRER